MVNDNMRNRNNRANHSSHSHEPSLLVALDVGSAQVACAVADVGGDRPTIAAIETVASYGIRCGEIVDLARATETIRIAIAAAADRAEADVRSVVVGLSGDVKLTSARAAIGLDAEHRSVTADDISRLRKGIPVEITAGRRAIHRFDGPFSLGDLQCIENPEGLNGDRLDLQASFLSAPVDRMDNVLKAVRAAGVGIEAVSLEPMSSSLGSLSVDERNLGAAVLDFGAGSFRGALWETGRLRQVHVATGEPSKSASGRAIISTNSSGAGMEWVVLAIARRFRIAPATAERLLRGHGALGESNCAELPAIIEVTAVDGLGVVKVETRELAMTLEELLAPVARSLREGLSSLSSAHTGGIVLVGGGAKIRGMADWISKRFGGMPTRLGVPRWALQEGVTLPEELSDCSACSLSGLIALGAEGRIRARRKTGTALLSRLTDRLKKFTASL
jgi:cell division protein FtsA